MKKIMAVVSITAALLLSGCGQAPWEDSLRDLEDVEVTDPDSTHLWNNIDKHPNIARLCLDGVAFATTTREWEPVLRVPEWDAICKADER